MPADRLDALAGLAHNADVDEAVERVRTAVDRLRAHPVLRRRTPDVAAETALRGARASAALEGVVWTIDEVRAVDRRRRAGAATVHGALRATAASVTLADSLARSPRHALARWHTLAAAGLAPEDDLGRPRRDDRVDDPLDLGPPPPANVLGGRLDGLVALLTTPTEAPALVVVAIVHGELLAVRPFGCSNGVVARAAARSLLRARGLDPDSLTAAEVGHLEQRTAYAAAARDYINGGADGVVAWVVHCADAVELGAREAMAVCEAMARG